MDFGKVNSRRSGSVPLTLKQVDSIYWLGRYTERVLTTLKIFMNVYDSADVCGCTSHKKIQGTGSKGTSCG